MWFRRSFRLLFLSIAASVSSSGCGTEVKGTRGTIGDYGFVAIWSRESRKPELIRMVLLPKGVPVTTFTTSGTSDYQVVKRGLQLTVDGVFLDGVQVADAYDPVVCVVRRDRTVVPVEVDERHVAALSSLNVDGLAKLPVWEEVFEPAIEEALANPPSQTPGKLSE
jgi:hypothetical protein